LAHAFLWEYRQKRLKLAQLLGRHGVFLTWWLDVTMSSAHFRQLRPSGTLNFGGSGMASSATPLASASAWSFRAFLIAFSRRSWSPGSASPASILLLKMVTT
jgi:hypothetical protein